MEQETFRISFSRTGGFTGRTNRAQIDSRDLSAGEAEELKHMIDRSGFFETLAFNQRALHMPDQFTYEITIEHEGKQRTLELNDTSIPELLRPLINYLVRISRPGKRD